MAEKRILLELAVVCDGWISYNFPGPGKA